MQSLAGRVLLIENDPQIKSLITDQALFPLGYQVDIYESASAVMQEITTLSPDVIITDLNLPGLSGKDLMMALGSQGSVTPIIVIANKDQESDILQAIRLGAADFLVCPLNEVEVVRVVEQTLDKSQVERQVEQATKQLVASNTLLNQQQANDSQIFSFGKSLLSAHGIQNIAGQACTVAMNVTEADTAWVSIYDGDQDNFKLLGCQNLPDENISSLDMVYDDELSALAAASGQVISLHGETLQRFKLFKSFGAALVIPMVLGDRETSILAIARNAPQPFSQYQQSMAELVTAFTSAALENEQRNRQTEHLMVILQQANTYATIESNLKYDLLRQASLELRSPLKYLMQSVDRVLEHSDPATDQEQTMLLNNILDQAEILLDIADSMINYRQVENIRLEAIDLNEVVRNIANRFRPIAQLGSIGISLDLPEGKVLIKAYSSQITRVIEGLLSNAIKYSPPNSDVAIAIELNESNIILSVSDQGSGIDMQMSERIFDVKSSYFGYTPKRFGGVGISLPRIKEIISAYHGRVWIEPVAGSGLTVKFSLPRPSAPSL